MFKTILNMLIPVLVDTVIKKITKRNSIIDNATKEFIDFDQLEPLEPINTQATIDADMFYNKSVAALSPSIDKQSFLAVFNTCVDAGLLKSYEQIAYIFATIYWETAKKFMPIEEYGKGKMYSYGKWETNSNGVKYCRKNSSNTSWYTVDECNNLYYGRGFVQLTWYDNYKTAGVKLKTRGIIDDAELFVNEPEKVMALNYAALIAVYGMIEGWFTGKKLSDYFTATNNDAVAARKIINGVDKADTIAGIYYIFLNALRNSEI